MKVDRHLYGYDRVYIQKRSPSEVVEAYRYIPVSTIAVKNTHGL